MPPPFSPPRSAATLAGWVLLCFSAAASGASISTGGWYEHLRKPDWNPPSWIFAPVWSALYTMMAVAAWLVWRRGGWREQRWPLGCFLLQWLLNALWTPLFFGLHLPGMALVEILLLWGTLVVTVVWFWRVRPVAGVLLLPYLAWVSFAAFLNFTLWRLNS